MNDVEWRRSVEQRLRELNQKVKMSRRAAVGGGGSGDDTQIFYTAASKALLETYTGVVVYARGRVISGDDNGVDYIRNLDNDGWVATNRLE